MNSVVKGSWGGVGEKKLKKMGVNIGTGVSVASMEGTKASVQAGKGSRVHQGCFTNGTGLGSGQVVPS